MTAALNEMFVAFACAAFVGVLMIILACVELLRKGVRIRRVCVLIAGLLLLTPILLNSAGGPADTSSVSAGKKGACSSVKLPPPTPEVVSLQNMGITRAEAERALAQTVNSVQAAFDLIANQAAAAPIASALRIEAPRFDLLGLENRSIDCWMVSALQVLLRLPQARQLASQIELLMAAGETQPSLDSLRVLADMFRHPERAEAFIGRDGQQVYLKKEGLAKLRYSLLKLGSTEWTLAKQHDSAEFLNFIIGMLSGTSLTTASSFSVRTVIPAGGEEVRYGSTAVSTMMPLNFPAELKKAYDIQVATNSTDYPEDEFQLSQLIANSYWTGGRIEENSEEIERGPDVLTVHLLRMMQTTTYPEGEETPKLVNYKIRNRVVFPERDLAVGGRIYTLHGVIYHRGGVRASGGHYHATARDEDSGWLYNYNDHVVSIAEDDIIANGDASNDATVLFYVADPVDES